MAKKSFLNNLKHTIEQQDESLKERFAVAESMLMRTPTSDLKNKKTSKKDQDEALVIRDTFSMPPNDYRLIDVLKKKALKQQLMVTKSEIVRAGLLHLNSLPEKDLKTALIRVERLKTGRKAQ
ncbi:MAG: hypothetical protein JZU65_02540 [Chlorobium sp.]|nr:hypothetical protein [Chlorobium sp.]